MAAIVEPTHSESRAPSATTLRTVVELVRRITHADVISIVSFSLAEKTMTWRAASGLRAHVVDEEHPLIRPLTNRIEERALAASETLIIDRIGQNPQFPAENFPVHVAEGVSDLAVVTLRARGETLGALLAGYRTPHVFSDEEKKQLEDLAAIAALTLDNARLFETIGEAESIWKQTFDAIREGILVYDRRGRIMHCNTHAAEMLEMDPIKVISLSFTEAFTRMFGKRAADYYLADNHGASTVVEVQTEDDRRYLVSISTVHKSDGTIISVSAWNDVTRLSEMQDQLGRSRRLASVGQLAAGVAHEVNNPLAAITTCAEAIIRDMRASPSEAAPQAEQWNYYLEEIVRQSLRCKEITRGLLDLTRQRQPKRTLSDINIIAKECAKIAVHRSAVNTQLDLKLDESIPQIATDTEMVRQVLDNFLINALQALGDDGGKVTVSTQRLGDRVALEVADTGAGIPAKLLSQIFDPFFSTKGPGKGHGLGLAISLTLAETLGGGINVESKEGEGSRFRLWLPRRAE